LLEHPFTLLVLSPKPSPSASSYQAMQLSPAAHTRPLHWHTPVEHEKPVPQLAAAQHAPSTQLPLLHWLLAVQATPRSCFGAQLPALQKFPLAQSASTPHVVLQAVAPHT
jgi:hypothetical protein